MRQLTERILVLLVIFITFCGTFVGVNLYRDQEMRDFENEMNSWYVETSTWFGTELLNLSNQLSNVQLSENLLVGRWLPVIPLLSGRDESLYVYANGTCNTLDDDGIWYIDDHRVIINVTTQNLNVSTGEVTNVSVTSTYLYCYCDSFDDDLGIGFLVMKLENDIGTAAYRVDYFRLMM